MDNNTPNASSAIKQIPAPFVDISGEAHRSYTFLGAAGTATVTIANPVKVLAADGGHYIEDSIGDRHFVPFNWIHLSWKKKDGAEDNVWPKHVNVAVPPATPAA